MTRDREQITEDRRQTISEFLCSRAEERIRSGTDGIYIVRELTGIIDNLLVSAYNSKLQPLNSNLNLSLVAIGGYGRREMSPFSDIDIMLLAKDRSPVNMEAAQSFLYPLWDMGLQISHCFRTLSECSEDSAKDIRIRTSLMESRFLAGDFTVFKEFQRDVYKKLLFKNRKAFFGDILRETEKRHHIYGNSVYLLEPNIKEGSGGLRDFHAISWFARSVLKMDNTEGIKGLLSYDEHRHFIDSYDFLLKIRLCLHYISRRKNDVLSFELQEAVSKALGFKDTKRFLSSEILMRLYYRKAKSITDVLAFLTGICSRQLVSIPGSLMIKRITDDFYLSKNEIVAKDKEIFKNPDRLLEAFYIYSITGKKFSQQVKKAIKSRVLSINRKTRSSKKAIMFFFEILRGNRVYETLKEMHDIGILDRFIPEFGRLRHLVVYEPHHKYTVDEHTLIAIKSLEKLKNTKQVKLHCLSDIFSKIKQETLFLALLLHDIGKGVYPRDIGIAAIKDYKRHEDAGYKILKGAMERLGAEHDDRQRIEFLVKNHIKLSKIALTRDPDTPETISQLADLVENQSNLDALYLVTYADMKAVNPYFWTEWKAYIFHDLYLKTAKHLQGVRGFYFDDYDRALKEFVDDLPDRYLISNTIDIVKIDYQLALKAKENGLAITVQERPDGTAELTIVTFNRQGLFSKIVGALGFRGLNVLRARLYTGKSGLVVDKIMLSNWKDIWWQGMEEQIKADLTKAIDYRQTAEMQKTYTPASIAPRQYLALKRFESFVEIDNETSDRYTILELFSADRLGLLNDVSTCFFMHNVDIMSSVINTEEGIAQDVFYLQHNGGKLNSYITLTLLNSVWEIIC
ncbi:MAG: [protein-PII] uridylyltransferase [Thermodesulfovibrionales bacterium]|nr:[protein-PII] uridylyltransferase [Thermodesulfovibrionales bacterium]